MHMLKNSYLAKKRISDIDGQIEQLEKTKTGLEKHFDEFIL
jgi:hypothetical protein